MKTPTTDLTVVGLHVDNYKRLTAADLKPSPQGLVAVRGKNAQGKSSLIGSMLDALGATKASADALPITVGERTATVVLDLGEIVVRKHWTRDRDTHKAKPSLSIVAKDGGKIRSPAAVLKELRGHFADPVAFLDLKAPEQVKVVLATLGLDEHLERLEAQAEAHYDARHLVNRDVTRLNGALEELELEVGGLPAPPADGTLAEAIEAVKAAKDFNADRAKVLTQIETVARRGKGLTARIEQLELELAQAQADRAAATAEWTAASADAERFGDEADLAPLTAAVMAHEAAARHQGRRDLLDSTREQYDTAVDVAEEADKALETTRAEIHELLSGTEFPVEGMAYDHAKKVLTVGEVPFSQASQAERLTVAAAVAMSGDPKIRVLFATDCSLLDDDSLALLAGMAEARGFQLWAEIVDSDEDGGSGVWVEDGTAHDAGAPAEGEA